MLADIRVELLELAVHRYTQAAVAEFLRVPVEQLHRWLIGKTAVPETVLWSLVDILDPDQRRH